MNILIVRLGALGDIVHTVPAAAALRRAFPEARIDWVVDARHAPFTELVTAVSHVVRLEKATLQGWVAMLRRLRPAGYDVAIDFQGLMKSAVLARASGARRVLGFSIFHLREKSARPFYTEVDGPDRPAHVIRKNLALLAAVGVEESAVEFPLAHVASGAREEIRKELAARPFALINPGAAWPNKRWPAAKYGEVAAFLRDVRGLSPTCCGGPGSRRSRRRWWTPRVAPRGWRRHPRVRISWPCRATPRCCSRGTQGPCTSPPPSGRRSSRSSGRPTRHGTGPGRQATSSSRGMPPAAVAISGGAGRRPGAWGTSKSPR
jgi:hypothetical protein